MTAAREDAATAAATTDAGKEAAPEPWPRGVSREPKYTIGKAVEKLRAEFPSLVPSKLRHIGSTGIIVEQRTASNYRKYSEADLQRIAFGLREQRENKTPWQIIRKQLEELDAGRPLRVEPTARLVSSEGRLVAPIDPGALITARELADYSGVDEDDLKVFQAAKLIAPDSAGYYPAAAIAVVTTAAKLAECGIPARTLSYLSVNARRHISLIKQVTPAPKPDQDGLAKESRLAHYTDLGQLIATLSTQILQMQLGQMD